MPDLFFQEKGNGNPVILIHGFPMNSRVWDEFAKKLSSHFKVYVIDLPGFGNSSILKAPFSLDDVAESVNQWILNNQIVNSVIIGHSLGGYVALAMVSKRPDWFAGLGLFHSTAYADSPEKRISRTKVIEFVQKNGALAFTCNFIQPLFADPNHPALGSVREIASKATVEAVIGYTLAMRDRPDRIGTLENFKKPVLFISGTKDAGILPETVLNQALSVEKANIYLLDNVSHMGMFENFLESVNIVRDFALRCFQ